jgi:phosphatidylglycerophosphate synthase
MKKSANEPRRYSTMDNVDGKQARRTGTSSPLGELFEYVTT